MKSEITKTTSTGTTITVSWSASMTNINLDGDVTSQNISSICTGIKIEKTGQLVVAARDANSLSSNYPGMPAGAAGVICGTRDNKEVVVPMAAEAYNMITEMLAQAKAQAESDCEQPAQQKAAPEMIINPKFADMSRAEIKAAEIQYDAINNEGGEGYNPYRDELFIVKP